MCHGDVVDMVWYEAEMKNIKNTNLFMNSNSLNKNAYYNLVINTQSGKRKNYQILQLELIMVLAAERAWT